LSFSGAPVSQIIFEGWNILSLLTVQPRASKRR
jgi:hypothetical protein